MLIHLGCLVSISLALSVLTSEFSYLRAHTHTCVRAQAHTCAQHTHTYTCFCSWNSGYSGILKQESARLSDVSGDEIRTTLALMRRSQVAGSSLTPDSNFASLLFKCVSHFILLFDVSLDTYKTGSRFKRYPPICIRKNHF